MSSSDRSFSVVIELKEDASASHDNSSTSAWRPASTAAESRPSAANEDDALRSITIDNVDISLYVQELTVERGSIDEKPDDTSDIGLATSSSRILQKS